MEADTVPQTRIGPHSRPFYLLAAAAVCFFVAGLALSRLLYEGLFPAWGWMGRPIPVLATAALIALAGTWGAQQAIRRGGAATALAGTPLLINLIWLLDPVVDPARARFLFAAGWWMAAAVLAHLILDEADRRWRWLGPLFVTVALGPVYLLTMPQAVGAADAFEFQVVAPQLGIAHPTGYPLYLLLGKLFSLLPLGTMAWRINLASAVYAVLAAAVVFRLGLRLLGRPLVALAGAVILGLLPIYWSQAIIAEVYTLHALIVASALLLILRLIDARHNATAVSTQSGVSDDMRHVAGDRKTMVALAFLLGLGLTNHLTTMFLLLPAALAIALNLWPQYKRKRPDISRRRSLLLLTIQLLLAFALPLLLYAYLPLRWVAIHGEPMGIDRFIDWVVAGRFQGALQWEAWLRDPARRQIIARLFLDAWGWPYLVLAAAGLAWLFARQWRAALVLLITAVGFTFYALNYYVPDLAVFLIPAHVVVAIWVAAGLAALVDLIGLLRPTPKLKTITSLLFLLAMLPAFLSAATRWSAVDQSGRDGGETWARGVLALPLVRRAAVLADSEKIAPLYYLQQTEQLRPDLDIMVLPDEAAYRAELDARLEAGQPVYLARYLPGLEGIYHLRSAGPLVEVSREPLTMIPGGVTIADQVINPLRLMGYQVDPVAAVDANAAAITLYWTLDRPLAEGERSPVIYLRWVGGEVAVNGVHPANDTYPVNAWRPGEVVTDFHLLPLPDPHCDEPPCETAIEVAVAPRFTAAADLAWHTLATVPLTPRPGPVGQPRRAYFDGFALDGIDFPIRARAGTTLPLRYSGFGDSPTFMLVPPHALSSLIFAADAAPPMRAKPDWAISRSNGITLEAATEEGKYVVVALPPGELSAVCGWLRTPATGCVVAEIDISGIPLPDGATNFDDRIALLDLEVDWGKFGPGGQLPVTLTWQGLAGMSEDYTVFVQLLDAADRIVGQVDAWPVQGTRPTSAWQPGEVVVDPYIVQLNPDIPPVSPGDVYRLHVGLYLLSTGQRLPVMDEAGNAVDDKVQARIVFD